MFNLKAVLSELEGKSPAVLHALYQEALQAEAAAKKELYMLRQRIANLSTDFDTEEEKALVEAKKLIADIITYIKALEMKLHGTTTVKDFNTAEKFEDDK